jgi:hypothetical protein
MDEPEYDADGTPTNEAGRFERFATEAWSDIKKSWNPIYAWSVIARSRKDDGTYFPLPDWCREYLSAVADGMIKHADQHSKEAKGTGAAIPPILFMSRSGWNAFKDFKADKRRKKLASSEILLQASGASAKKREEVLMTLSGVRSPRARLRLMKEAKTGAKRSRMRLGPPDQT